MKKHTILWWSFLSTLITALPVLLCAQVINGVLSEREYPNVSRTPSGNYTLAWAVKEVKELGGTNDILEFAGTEKDGVTTIEFSRSLNPADAYDKPISLQGGDVYMWAYGSSDDITVKHTERGKGVPSTGKAKPLLETSGILLAIHLSVRSLAFAFMTSGMLIARYLKKRRWWLKTHRWFGIAGSSLAVVGLVVAILMVSAWSGIHLRVVHSWFGVVTTALILASPFLGQAYLKVKKDLKPFYRQVHHMVGRATLFLMFVTIVLGLFQAKIL